jgi:Ring finger domain
MTNWERRILLCLLLFLTGILPLVSVSLMSLWNHFVAGHSSKNNSVDSTVAGLTMLDRLQSFKHGHHWMENTSTSLGQVTRRVTSLLFDSQAQASLLMQHAAYQEQTTMIRAMVATIIVVLVPLLAYIYALCTHPRMQQFRKQQALHRTSPSTNPKLSPRKERIRTQLMEYRTTFQGPQRRRPSWWEQTFKKEHRHNDDSEQFVECPICLGEFRNGDTVTISTHCNCKRTIFHETCILMWLAKRHRNPYQQCPCCRSAFFSTSSTTEVSLPLPRPTSEIRSFYRVRHDT